MTTPIETILSRLQTVEDQLADNQADLQHTQAELERTQRRLQTVTRRTRLVCGLAFVTLLGALLTISRPAAMAQAGVTLSSLLARVVALETKTAALSQTGTPGTASAKLTITGDNVQIVDGSGYTDDGTQGETTNKTLKGLGNLMIGYDQKGNFDGDIRTGSHNLILGDKNNFSSFGGIIAGVSNTINGPYASVSGGAANVASGQYSSVSGGNLNTASGIESSISGGMGNMASGEVSSVSGGAANSAPAGGSSVSGGLHSVASAVDSSVSGGDFVTQSNPEGWSGGAFHSP